MIDVVLTAAPGGFGDQIGCLTLGADEQHSAAAGHGIAHQLEGAMEQRPGLLKVDDMGAVADAKNIGAHFRIPAPCLVSEMNAGFEKLAHGERRQSHDVGSFSGYTSAGVVRFYVRTPERRDGD